MHRNAWVLAAWQLAKLAAWIVFFAVLLLFYKWIVCIIVTGVCALWVFDKIETAKEATEALRRKLQKEMSK